MPNYRKFGNKMLDKMTNIVAELSVRDTQSGFRAYSKNIINLVDFKKKGLQNKLDVLNQQKENRENNLEQAFDNLSESELNVYGKNLDINENCPNNELWEWLLVWGIITYIGICSGASSKKNDNKYEGMSK